MGQERFVKQPKQKPSGEGYKAEMGIDRVAEVACWREDGGCKVYEGDGGGETFLYTVSFIFWGQEKGEGRGTYADEVRYVQ